MSQKLRKVQPRHFSKPDSMSTDRSFRVFSDADQIELNEDCDKFPRLKLFQPGQGYAVPSGETHKPLDNIEHTFRRRVNCLETSSSALADVSMAMRNESL